MREAEDLREVKRREIENDADRESAEAVRGDETPEAALEGIRNHDALRLRAVRFSGKVDSAAISKHPGQTRDAGHDEGRTPTIDERDGSDDEWRDDRAERSAAIGDGEAARLLMRGQPVGRCAQTAGKRGAFAESQNCARYGEAEKT